MAHGAPGQTWGTAWTDAGILCPWTMWKVYGDTRLLERHWASMTRFMEWRRQRAPDFRGQKDGNSWGDWLNVNESTPLEFIDAAYFKLDAMVMAQMARALGRTNESESYHKLQSDIAAQFGRDYLLEDGTLKVNTQTAYVLTLAFNLTAQTNRPALATRLAGMIAKNDARMATGFLGTKHLLPALTENGQNDLACRLFQSRRFPSWGYEVVNGATSVWERWDSYTKEHGFNGAGGEQNAAMNSFSHYSFGAVMQWAFQELAGIDTYGPGFKWLVLRPNPPTPGSNPEQPAIHWVTAEYGSAHGRIASAWKRLPAGLELNVTIPANTEATVVLPAQAADEVTESGQPLTQAEGVKFLRGEGGRIALTVESGSYSFLVRADK
jgi:alpha-L-rhamnosidase